MFGFSAKLVRLNFLFVEPFGLPGGRFLISVITFVHKGEVMLVAPIKQGEGAIERNTPRG